jgi:hypothetical protein
MKQNDDHIQNLCILCVTLRSLRPCGEFLKNQ